MQGLITRSSPWIRSEANIVFEGGKVGIGTSAPHEALHVVGDAKFTVDVIVGEAIVHDGDPNTRIAFTDDRIDFSAGNVSFLGLYEVDPGQSEFKINNGYKDIDTIIRWGLPSGGGVAFFVEGSSGNVGIGTTALPTGVSSGTPALALTVASADPVGIGTNTAGIFVKDILDDAKLHAFDENGSVTLLSPHDPVTNKWIFESRNLYSGKTIRIDMEILVRAVEALTGQIFIHEGKLPAGDIQDWDANQVAQVVIRDAQIAAFKTLTAEEQAQQVEPAVYVAKPKPAFLA